MTLDPITSTNTTTSATTQTGTATVDYDTFLKLLVTQMKNQDPTQPMDSTDYVAQLATFSQVEQTMQTNSKIDQLMQASMLDQAGALIGRTLTTQDGQYSGVVEKVQIASDGLIAVFEDETALIVEPGMIIS